MSLPDDLDDYKLETAFQNDPNCVFHKSYRVYRGTNGFRQAEILDRWIPQRGPLGAEAFGTVRLEKRCREFDKGTETSFRAVKELRKWYLRRHNIDYKK
jgi:hypothetical protein